MTSSRVIGIFGNLLVKQEKVYNKRKAGFVKILFF